MNFPSLYHYNTSAEPPVPYYAAQGNDPFPMKPKGLWVTPLVEANWEEWCRSEQFGLERLRFRHRLILHSDANVLWIKTESQLDEFTKKYTEQPPDHMSFMRGFIDWQTVTEKYQGLLITPYLWSRRLDSDSFWYYGWDCASGCIWSPNAFASVERDTTYVDSGIKSLT